MTAGTRLDDGRRSFEVRVRLVLPSELSQSKPKKDAPRDVVSDLLVTFAADTTVADLIDAVFSRARLRARSRGKVALRRTVLHARDDAGEHHRFENLEETALLVTCGLVDGEQLEVIAVDGSPATERSAASTAREPGYAGLVLIDERGTHRGRVTPLVDEHEVVVGALSEESAVIVDDLVFGTGVLRFVGRSGHVVLTPDFPEPGPIVLVSGTVLEGGRSAELMPGATVSVARSIGELPRVSFTISSADALEGRSPFGKVRLDAIARQGPAPYPVLGDRHSRIRAQPVMGERQPFHWETIAATFVMSLAFAAFSGTWLFVLLAPIGAVPSVVNYIRSANRVKRQFEKDRRVWLAEVDSTLGRLSELVGIEEAIRRAETLSSGDWALNSYRRLPGLWGVQPADRDFLVVRVGQGTFPSRYHVSIDPGVDTAEEELRGRIFSDGRDVQSDTILPKLFSTPATVELARHHLGVVGPIADVRRAMTDIVLQLAGAHSPGLLSIVALLPADSGSEGEFDWLRWLPHVTAPSAGVPLSRIARGHQSANSLLVAMFEELAARNAAPADRARTGGPHVVLLVHEAAEIDRYVLSEVLRLGGEGYHLLWVGTGVDRIPHPIKAWVDIHGDEPNGPPTGALHIGNLEQQGDQDWEIEVGAFADDLSLVARQLAPLYDPRVVGASAGIPSLLPLSAVTHVEGPTWKDSSVERLVMTVGVGVDGVRELDLQADGPHVLVGGTTGSGKSELLQTMVATLALRYDPSELSLFLVDFKGGTTFGDFRVLPHVVGFVSDLDGGNVDRSLAFLKAEIRRRGRKFSEHGNAKDYRDHRRWAAAHVLAPLPRLVVFFDEFATLAQDHGPEAEAAILDIAQRGRAYGVHLVLATQRPSSDVVSAKVRANVRARIALQTLSTADSETVIDSPEAALIPRSLSGRALLRLEGATLHEFQTAYAGAEFGAGRNVVRLRLSSLEDSVEYRVEMPRKVDASEESAEQPSRPRELHVAIAACVDAADRARPADVRVLEAPLFDDPQRPLPARPEGMPPSKLLLGRCDRPHEQEQDTTLVDLAAGAFVVTGPSGVGKSSTLDMLARQWLLATPHDAEVVWWAGSLDAEQPPWRRVSIWDFAEITRSIDQLQSIIEGGDDDQDEEEAAASRTSVLLVIDGIDQLLPLFEGRDRSAEWLERLDKIVRFGRSRGVFVVMSAAKDGGYLNRFAPDIARRVALGANYAKHQVARVDWLAGFGLTDDDELIQIYRSTSDPVRVSTGQRLVDWRQPTRRDVDGLLESADAGTLVLGNEDLFSRPVLTTLAERPLMVVGHRRTSVLAAAEEFARQLTQTGSGRLLVATRRTLEPGSRFVAFPHDQLAAVANRDPNSLGRAFLEIASELDALEVSGRPVIWIDDGHVDTSRRGLGDAILQLHRADGLGILWSSGADAARNPAGSPDIRTASQILFVAPNPRADLSEGSSVSAMPLEHRPRVRYASGQGLLQRDGSQTRIWMPETAE